MLSSISNSDMLPVNAFPLRLPSSTAQVFLLAGALALLVGLLRPGDTTIQRGMVPDLFWTNKLLWDSKYNIVAVGDSRVYRGIAPQEIEPVLGHPMANFGFSGGALTKEYLVRAEALLRPVNSTTTIIVGVSPHSLTPGAARANGFLELQSLRSLDLLENRWISPVLHFFRPLSIDGLILATLGRAQPHYEEDFYPNGWVASRRTPPFVGLDGYDKLFIDNRVSPRLEQDLLDSVAAWTKKGILVLGVRPPASEAVTRLEDEMSGFNENLFATRFEGVGGRWMPVIPGSYATYDGSHLDEESARRFSRDIAARLVKLLGSRHAHSS